MIAGIVGGIVGNLAGKLVMGKYENIADFGKDATV